MTVDWVVSEVSVRGGKASDSGVPDSLEPSTTASRPDGGVLAVPLPREAGDGATARSCTPGSAAVRLCPEEDCAPLVGDEAKASRAVSHIAFEDPMSLGTERERRCELPPSSSITLAGGGATCMKVFFKTLPMHPASDITKGDKAEQIGSTRAPLSQSMIACKSWSSSMGFSGKHWLGSSNRRLDGSRVLHSVTSPRAISEGHGKPLASTAWKSEMP
mmetsp:Transcript_142187/g.247829  ORF Transcript_142187/g.247829 Transcript_142187/m.247829 type:complete len:217 (+) Transcript_142187:885-1535(+)